MSQSSSANLSDEDISSADVVVVSLSRNVDLLKQLQSRQASVNAIAPIVARVPREMFELGIEAMSQGALTVVSCDQKSAFEWTETFAQAKITLSEKQHVVIVHDAHIKHSQINRPGLVEVVLGDGCKYTYGHNRYHPDRRA